MNRKILITSVLMILIFMLFSCGSSPQASGEALALSGCGFNEASEASRSSQNVNDDRMVTYSVSMQLSVNNIGETRESVVEQIEHYNGFIVRETESSITTRIPSEKMDDFLNNIKALGKIENETKTGTDITDQYRDNVLRLDSLKNVRERYLALLERADTVIDILAIEKELERVNLEIEILEGRINHAQLSVSYSLITVRFREKAKPGPLGWIFYGLYHGIKWLFVW